ELIFLGTGTSSCVPVVSCLTDPEQACKTCISTLTPGNEKNVRRNTSLLVRFEHPDGRLRTVIIDCGKTFYESTIKYFVEYGLRQIDAIILTHGHADAILGLDDLRQWTLGGRVQSHIPIYLSSETLEVVEHAFPYLVDRTKATGGGDIPSLQFIEIEKNKPLNIEGLEFIPLEVHHGFKSKGEPLINLGFRFGEVSYVSDVSYIPPETRAQILGSQVFILDMLKPESHPSHYGVQEALEEARRIKAGVTLFTGFCHRLDH
ncbi:Metallo-hydrolase/oxidoreductase, partial [Basidiobolus meristosporus CBS 931.73]